MDNSNILKIYSTFSYAHAESNDNGLPVFDWNKPYTLNNLKCYCEFLYDYYCQHKQFDESYLVNLYYDKLLPIVMNDDYRTHLTDNLIPPFNKKKRGEFTWMIQ